MNECELCYQEIQTDDYLLTIRRPDGSIVKILLPREDTGDTYTRLCMMDDVVHGLNLVTEGHYS